MLAYPKFISSLKIRVFASYLLGNRNPFMLSLAELHQKKVSSIDKVEAFRLQQQELLEKGQRWFILPALLLLLGGGLLIVGRLILGIAFLGSSLVVFLLIGAFKIIPAYTRYNDLFTRKVLYALLEDLYPSVYYAPDNYMPSSVLAKTHLYPIGEIYMGKDYVEGETKKGDTFRFSELLIKNKDTGNKEVDHLFKGLFWVVDMVEPCQDPIYILPTADPLAPEKRKGLNVYPLEQFFTEQQRALYTQPDTTFLNRFSVYCKDIATARNFLNDTIVKALYHWYTQWQCAAHISFIGQQLFMALPMSKVFPSPDLSQKLPASTDLNRFYDQLLYGLSIVEIYGEDLPCPPTPEPQEEEKISPKKATQQPSPPTTPNKLSSEKK